MCHLHFSPGRFALFGGQKCLPLRHFNVVPACHEANAAVQDFTENFDLLFVSRTV